MDDLTELCKKIEECRKYRNCSANEILCVRSRIRDYAAEDKNKILRLKAQIKINNSSDTDSYAVISLIVAILAFTISILDVISCGDKTFLLGFAMFGLILVFVLCQIFIWDIKKYSYRNKLKKYIETVLDEIDINDM